MLSHPIGGPSCSPTEPGASVLPTTTPTTDSPPKVYDSPRPTLVYITGSHRSGGTILGLLLAAHPEVFLTGALYKLPVPAWTPGRTCSCGVPVPSCPFWTSVVKRFEGSSSLDELRRGQARYETWEALPRSLVAQAFRTRGARRHAGRMAALVQAIAAQSGRRVIVDASRTAHRGRLYSMARSEDLDVAFIHLVRDGRAYMSSELKLPGITKLGRQRTWIHAPAALALRWMLQNLLSVILCSSGRYLRIRYEDLVLHPEEVLSQIGQFVGVDFQPVIQLVRNNQTIPIEHVLPGNRFVKEAPTASLWSRPVRGSSLGPGTKLVFWTIAGWFAGFLGYRPKGSDS